MHIHERVIHSAQAQVTMEEEALVEAKHDVIYDLAQMAYHNKDKREKAWKVVSEDICQSGILTGIVFCTVII